MEKIGFVTDSTAYLDTVFIDRYQVEVVSLIVNFKGESVRRKNGMIDVYEKVCTREKGVNRILEGMAKVYQQNSEFRVGVVEVGVNQLGKDLIERVHSLYPELESAFCLVGPVIGVLIGPGTVGRCYYPQIKELY